MLASLSNEPLNDAELGELRAFLASGAWTGNARRFSSLDELRGFFAAVICTPEMILPSEWLGAAFGELHYENHAQSERTIELVLRFYNDVSRDLGHAEKMASWSAPAGGPAPADLWCRGFIRGMAVRDEEWRGRHRDDELYRCLLAILALGGASPDNPLAGLGKTRHDELLALLPQSISTLYARMRRLSDPHAPQLEAGNEVLTLPSYEPAELAACGVAELLAMMIRDEDRVPRNVIDELARRGAETLEVLRLRLNSNGFWSQGKTSGEWWLRLHLVMVLGLMPDAEAGELLVMAMRRMSEGQDEDLQDWFGGYWPALFRNKPASLAEPLRTLSEDRTLDWYIRSFATEAVVALAARAGQADLEAALDWLARLVADETEDWDMRVCSATTLIEFPRASHRALLEELAKRQKRPDVHFAPEEIEEAYASGVDEPGWRRFEDPWRFYIPATITARQKRWAKEDAEEERREASEDAGYEDDFEDEEAGPYVRLAPKIGRNDPCPCGSGKKFKKCHGASDAGPTLH